MNRIGELLGQLTLEEKAELLSGRDFWNLKGVERLGLPSICITDGPHGVRKTGGSHASLSVNEEATCFPTACAAACSFDEALLEELGRALGRECREKSVAVLLGPGANIKRSPLGGRNFEYFSEDPLVSGKLAAAVIRGMESMNVGASLKHFAANNQERCRMVGSSQVDERALREIYLAGFETAVREGKPATVMCSYNRINEVYACESRRLLTEILREEWGFEGLVVTDWGGMDRRVEALEAGCDLEMPGDAPENTRLVLEAVRSGRLSVETLDRAVERILRLIVREMGNTPLPADRAAHHALAGRIAGESGVLVQNDGTLPLKPGQRVALIGRFARYPRYQGSGSSRIEPTRITSAEEAFLAAGVAVRYAEGYGEAEIQPDPCRLREAAEAARDADAAVVFVGLPELAEGEGWDRENMDLPPSHVALVETVAATGTPTAVVLCCGGPVAVPFAERVGAILIQYLAGQNGGSAAFDLLYGRVNPSGKLAESWPKSLDQCAATPWFGKRDPEYRESVYVGYRWYETAGVDVRWPFGHGLSYTSFALEGMQCEGTGAEWTVRCRVRNTGPVFGKEVVQLYVAPPEGTLFRPALELRGFQKVALEPGESREIAFRLTRRDFAVYDREAADWRVDGGTYTLKLGASSRDIRCAAEVEIPGDGPLPDLRTSAPCYYHPTAPLRVDDAAFAAVLGRPVPKPRPARPFHRNSALVDLRACALGRIAFDFCERHMDWVARRVGCGGADYSTSSNQRKMVENMVYYMPLRALPAMSQGKLRPCHAAAIMELCNGHPLRALRCLIEKRSFG